MTDKHKLIRASIMELQAAITMQGIAIKSIQEQIKMLENHPAILPPQVVIVRNKIAAIAGGMCEKEC